MGDETFTPGTGGETFTVVGLGELIWDVLPEGRGSAARRPTSHTSHACSAAAQTRWRWRAASAATRSAARRSNASRARASPQSTYRLMRRTRRGRSASHSTRAARRTSTSTRTRRGTISNGATAGRSWPRAPTPSVRHTRPARRAVARRDRALPPSYTPRRAARLRREPSPLLLRRAMLAASLRLATSSSSARKSCRSSRSLAGVDTGTGGERATAERLARVFDLQLVAVTRGARGSLLVTPDGSRRAPRLPRARGRHHRRRRRLRRRPRQPSPPPRHTRRGRRRRQPRRRVGDDPIRRDTRS